MKPKEFIIIIFKICHEMIIILRPVLVEERMVKAYLIILLKKPAVDTGVGST